MARARIRMTRDELASVAEQMEGPPRLHCAECQAPVWAVLSAGGPEQLVDAQVVVSDLGPALLIHRCPEDER